MKRVINAFLYGIALALIILAIVVLIFGLAYLGHLLFSNWFGPEKSAIGALLSVILIGGFILGFIIQYDNDY